eukprot:352775-Chlamydomonas_euryale.AAC.15
MHASVHAATMHASVHADIHACMHACMHGSVGAAACARPAYDTPNVQCKEHQAALKAECLHPPNNTCVFCPVRRACHVFPAVMRQRDGHKGEPCGGTASVDCTADGCMADDSPASSAVEKWAYISPVASSLKARI